MRKILGIKDFFYVPDRSYDYLAEKSLPCYHEAHHVLVASLGLGLRKKTKVIDLGVGTGVTSAYILKNYPQSSVIGVDLFEEMLSEAKARLKIFKERMVFAQSDNSGFLKRYSGQVDAIVSSFCIHHLDENGKKELFRLAFKKLLPGGRFIMIDWSTFKDPLLRRVNRQISIRHMVSKVKEISYQKKWIYHWNHINTPSPADSMITWLNKAGFKTETAFRRGEVCVLVGVKSK